MIFWRISSLVALIFSVASAHAEDRLAFSPNSVQLLPGDSIQVTVSLSEPVIVPEPPGYVTLNLLSGDERVSISPSTLTWSDSDWFQSQTFRIEMTGNEAPRREFSLASLGITIDSNSEFYKEYIPTFSVIAGRGPLLIDSFESIPSPAILPTPKR